MYVGLEMKLSQNKIALSKVWAELPEITLDSKLKWTKSLKLNIFLFEIFQNLGRNLLLTDHKNLFPLNLKTLRENTVVPS